MVRGPLAPRHGRNAVDEEAANQHTAALDSRAVAPVPQLLQSRKDEVVLEKIERELVHFGKIPC